MKKTILEDISVYSMKILIIDTSQKIGVAILYSQGLGSEKKKEFDSREQQKVLIDSIDSLFKESYTTLTDLTHIAICIGPGSFTGTRIGVMTGKTLAYGANLPLIPFNSLIPFHTPGTLTLLGLKNEECYCFDGITLEKIPYTSLSKESRPLFALDPTIIPFPTKQATYSLDNILALTPQEEFSLLY